MPLKIETVEPNGVCLIGSGDISGEDLFKANKEIYLPPEMIRKCDFQIIDFLNVNSLNISAEMVEKITAQDKYAYSMNPAMKMVCVAEKENIFNLFKMWESFVTSESFSTKVVRTLGEAYDWLGLREKIQKINP